jgi:hypothetical protein
MEGMFSFDRTPMALIGTEVMIHIKPTRRQTWGYHAIRAWYFTPALNHYSCIKAVTDDGLFASPTHSNSYITAYPTQQLLILTESSKRHSI